MSKSLHKRLVKLFSLSEVKNVPLDSKERTLRSREIINEKIFLKRVYGDIYKEFQKIEGGLTNIGGDSLEIGSGPGFLKDFIPGVITSDILKYDHVDRVENAYSLGFDNHSLKAIYMVDVLHHLGDVKLFFKEANRCLRPGGKLVMVEPYASFWGKILYKYLHHEAYDDTVKDWEFPDRGPLSSSNTALPTVIFHRDRGNFESLFPNLKIQEIRYHNFLLYILSGGLSMRQLVPSFSYNFFSLLEKILKPLMKKYLGAFQTVVLRKI